jgi:hypothetical protein
MSNVGVPIRLLYEAEGMKITTGNEVGDLQAPIGTQEDTMNVNLSDVLGTARNGQISSYQMCVGHSIRFIAPRLAEILHPCFKRLPHKKRKMEKQQHNDKEG